MAQQIPLTKIMLIPTLFDYLLNPDRKRSVLVILRYFWVNGYITIDNSRNQEQIARDLGKLVNNISPDLKALAGMGFLIVGKKEGRNHYYMPRKIAFERKPTEFDAFANNLASEIRRNHKRKMERIKEGKPIGRKLQKEIGHNDKL